MNLSDRKKVVEIVQKLNALAEQVESLADAEREKIDNLPEGLADSENAEKMIEAADALEEAFHSIEDAVTELGDLQ